MDEFLEELEVIRSRWELPWCIGGDFNEVLSLEERTWAASRSRGMEVFCDFVDRNKLINVPLSGARFTWSNFQERPSMSKLDKFLISIEWDNYFFPVHA